MVKANRKRSSFCPTKRVLIFKIFSFLDTHHFGLERRRNLSLLEAIPGNVFEERVSANVGPNLASKPLCRVTNKKLHRNEREREGKGEREWDVKR